MKTVGAKLEEELHKQVLEKCQGRGCRPSDYIRDLVKRDMAGPPAPEQPPKPAPKSRLVIVDEQDGKAQPAAQEKPTQIIKIQYPRWIPYTLCKGNDCGGIHKNPGYSVKVAKKCTNLDCEQKIPAYAKRCPMCGCSQFEDLDEYDLLDIPNPKPPRELCRG